MGAAIFENIGRVHITEAAARRIEKNMGIAAGDAAPWCMRQLDNPESVSRTDKHWNVRGNGFVIVIDAQSYAIVTARREKQKKGGSLEGVHIIKRLVDVPELRCALIRVFEAKTHRNVSLYGMLLADHLLQIVSLPIDEALAACHDVNRRWRNGDATFQEARNAGGEIYDMARAQKDPAKEKALRALAQVTMIPHVKRHALIASDYAVKVVNLQSPGDIEAVRRERTLQIRLMESV